MSIEYECVITDKEQVKKLKKLITQQEIADENRLYQKMGVQGN